MTRINQKIQSHLTELQDRQHRKNNLVFFNIEKSSSDDVEERQHHDMTAAQEGISSEINMDTQMSKPVEKI